jgi:hypothetical protein
VSNRVQHGAIAMQSRCEFCQSLVEVAQGDDTTGGYASVDWAELRRACPVLSRRTDGDTAPDAVLCEVLTEQIRWSRTAAGRQREVGPADLRGGGAFRGQEY